MKELVDKCVAGEKINNICDFGDRRLQDETSRVFKKDKEMKKGGLELGIEWLDLMDHRYVIMYL